MINVKSPLVLMMQNLSSILLFQPEVSFMVSHQLAAAHTRSFSIQFGSLSTCHGLAEAEVVAGWLVRTDWVYHE